MLAERSILIEHQSTYSCVRFRAMASPCELLIAGVDPDEIGSAAQICADEAWRIEDKFSRYRKDNAVYVINQARGLSVEVDEETAGLLDFASLCFELSAGRFDITSGALRQVWHFDGSTSLPSFDAVQACLHHVGWHKVLWQRPWFTLPVGMEIDLGGIGKEYAVDRAFLAVQQLYPDAALLINFGGDLRAGRAPSGADTWHVALENPQGGSYPSKRIAIHNAALATSGDTHRYVEHEGKRYGHIIDPKTGWPVEHAPRSITVAAPTCLQAGMLSTFAMLHGAGAERFLENQQLVFWCLR